MSYPISILNNVFDKPQEILELAKETDYAIDPDNVSSTNIRETSPPLEEIYPELYDTVMKSTLYNFYEDLDFFHAYGTCFFHRTKGNSDQELFLHRDKSILTGVFYLTDDSLNNGIEIYQPSSLHGSNKDISKLQKIASINANFNSMVVFPGYYPHRPLISSQSSQYRYTIRLFIKNLCGSATPADRMKFI